MHDAWMPVRLPCAGMVTPTWLLGPLLMGASSVGVIACGDSCRSRQEEKIAQQVDFCRKFLDSIRAPRDLVRMNPDPSETPVGDDGFSELANPFDPLATAEVLQRLARRYETTQSILTHPASPLGVVEIQKGVCTSCGVCAGACPTGALAYQENGGRVTITFDASTCVGCGECLPNCPELARGAIRLSKAVNLAGLAQGRVTIYAEETAKCVSCGAQIAPLSMMNRIGAILDSEDASLMAFLTRYCADCRVTIQI